MSLDSFTGCIFRPVVSGESIVAQLEDGTWKLSGFYQDSSLRSSFLLPLELQCPSKKVLDEIVATKCLETFIGNSQETAEETSSETATSTTSLDSLSTMGIEVKVLLTFGNGEAVSALVENVVIKSARINNLSIYMDTEITVRVRSDSRRLDPDSIVKITLEVSSVLTEELPMQSQADAAVESLKALNLGGLPEIDMESEQQRIRRRRLSPFELVVSLTYALRIAVSSVPSHTMGQTYVSLTMSHSNTHSGTLTITNIALHPGHSAVRATESPVTGRQQVSDMSRFVKWTYAPDSAPNLPLKLEPYESFSTCLVVNATGDRTTRSFSSPISVTASIGASNNMITSPFRSVIAACDVQWTTSRAAVSPADAFRVDLRVKDDDNIIFVGAPLTVELEILNLAAETRQIMILVDNSGEVGLAIDKKEFTKNRPAVVSTKTGHKFGVWGLGDSGNDSDKEMLAIDVALLLGDLKPNSTKKTEIRLIALKEGALNVPNFKIIDRRKGKWYSAVHNLQFVAHSQPIST
jgi:hypothetical protein